MRRDRWLSGIMGLALIAAWEGGVRLWQTSALVLPAPSVVAQSLWQGLASGYLLPHAWRTVQEVVLGLLLGAGLGFAGGLLLHAGDHTLTLDDPRFLAVPIAKLRGM